MSSLSSRLQTVIDRFVAEISVIAREEAVQLILAGFPARTLDARRNSTPAPASASSRSRARGRRTAESVETIKKSVLEAIRGEDGIGVEGINAKLGTKTKDLALPIRYLLAEKAIKKKGNRRATKYFASE